MGTEVPELWISLICALFRNQWCFDYRIISYLKRGYLKLFVHNARELIGFHLMEAP